MEPGAGAPAAPIWLPRVRGRRHDGWARLLGIASSHGSVEQGKVANFVLYDGGPLEASTSPGHLFIRGQRIPLISRHTFLADPFLDR